MPGVGHAARRKAPSIGACTEMLHAEWPRLSGLAQNGQEKTASPAAASPVEHRVPAGAVLRDMVRHTNGSEHGWCGTRPQRRGPCSGSPHPAVCPVWRAGPLSPGTMQVRLNASCPARWSCLSWLSPGRALHTTPRQTRMGAGGVVYWGSGRAMQTPLSARAAPLQGAGRFMAGRFRAGVSAPESASSAGTSAGGRPADARACCPAGSR